VSTAIARNLMAEMKLGGMLAAFDKTVTDATRDQLGYSEFLDVLLQAEADYRGERVAQRRLKAAKLPTRVSLDDFDYTARRSITKAQIREIQGLGWLKDGRPLLLIGQTGVGKSFIAQAIALQVCQHGRSALYLNLTTWLENLALARASGTYLRYREKLAKPDVLILDLCAADRYVEFGDESAINAASSSLRTSHNCGRHNRRNQPTTSMRESATRPPRGAARTSGNTWASACRFRSRSARA
jgi:DNA replication protein DnaC